MESRKKVEKERTDHNPLPRCPYCGGEMKERVLSDYGRLCFWRCPKCRATSPSANTVEGAYAVAMQRCVEPNRVLTLEEVKDACELDNETVLLWVEFNCNGVCTLAYQYCTMGEAIATVYMIRPYDEVETDFSKMEYRKKWRCWLRKPTHEEMEAVPWGDD